MYRLYNHPYQPVIIDDEIAEEKFKEWKKFHPDATAVTLEEVLEHIYQSPLIKTAENIYDLIEEGDLVQYGKGNHISKIEADNTIYKSESLTIDMLDLLKENNLITAIYKPDSRGNYFKVKILEG